jgi:hypothetical protein
VSPRSLWSAEMASHLGGYEDVFVMQATKDRIGTVGIQFSAAVARSRPRNRGEWGGRESQDPTPCGPARDCNAGPRRDALIEAALSPDGELYGLVTALVISAATSSANFTLPLAGRQLIATRNPSAASRLAQAPANAPAGARYQSDSFARFTSHAQILREPVFARPRRQPPRCRR